MDLRVYIHTPSILFGKPVVDFQFVIIELFSLSLIMVESNVISGNLSKSAFLKGWATLSANHRRKGRHPPTTVGVRKLE